MYRLNRPLAPHAHREGHLVFLISGQPATVLVNGVRHVVNEDGGRGEPWEPHEFRPTDLGAGATFLTLYITPRWFEDMSRSTGEVMRFGAPQLALGEGLRRLCRIVADMMADGHTGDRFPGYLYELTTAPATSSPGRRRATALRRRRGCATSASATPSA